MKKWSLRIVLGLCLMIGTAALLVFSLPFILETDAAREFLQSKIDETIAGKAVWSRAHLSLIHGRLQLEGVRLESPSGEPVVTVDRIGFDISLKALLSGTLLVEDAQIAHPTVHLVMGRDKRLNLVDALAPTEKKTATPVEKGDAGTPFPFNVQIQDFRITGGSFRFSSTLSGETETAALEKIDFRVSDADLAQRSGRVAAQFGKCRINMAGIRTGWEHFRVDARVKDGEIRPVTAELESEMMSLTLEGDGREPVEDPVVEMALSLETTLEAIRKTFGLPADLAGSAAVHLKGHGRVSNPTVDVRLVYGGGRIYGTDVQGFDLTGRLSDRVLTLGIRDVDTSMGTIALSGTLDLKNAFPKGFLSARRNLQAVSYRVDAAFKRVDLKALDLKETAPGGRLTGRVAVDGKGVALDSLDARGTVDLTVTGLTQNTLKAPVDFTLSATAALSGKTLRVDAFAADIESMHLEGNGDFGWETGRIEARIALNAPEIRRPASLFGAPALDGALKAALHLHGSIQTPSADLELEAKSLSIEGMRIGDLQARLRLENGRLEMTPLHLQDKDAVVMMEGSAGLLDPKTLDLVPDPPLNLVFNGRNLRLEEFTEGISGALSFHGRVDGTLGHPEGTLEVTADQADLYGQKMEKITVNARMQNDRVFLEPLQILISKKETINGTGWIFIPEKTYSLLLVSENLSLNQIHWLSQMGLEKGKAKFRISGEGELENPRASADIVIGGVSIRGKPIGKIRLEASLADQVIAFRARSDLDLSGRFHIRNLDFSAEAAFHETALSPYFETAGLGQFSGTLSGIVSGRGNVKHPEKIDAEVDLSRLELFWDEKRLVQSQRFKASLAGSEVAAENVRLKLLDQGHANIRGRATLKGDMDLTLDAAIPLKGLSPLVPWMGNVAGRAALVATIRGAAASPEISGNLTLKEVKLTPPGFFREIRDGAAVIRITPDAVRVDALSGKIGKGRFDLRGQAAIDGWAPSAFSFTLDASAIPLSIPGTLDIALDGRLSLDGNRENSLLSGELVLAEGLYYKDVKLNLLERKIEETREPAPPSPESVDPILQHMQLDISIRQKNPFVVDNNLALLNIVSDLQVKGTPVQPRLLGTARVKEGTVAFLGREFEITRGVIDFVNPYRIEPAIDIQSRIKVRDWTILLSISGTPDELVFTKTSTPPESDEDILMLLTLGKTRREMIREEGGTWISSKALAAQLASEILGDRVKETTGLDVFETRYLEKEEASGADAVEVTVGKELSKRLTVKYTVEARGGETLQRALSEYRLLENVAVSAYQENTGNFGAEMVYRLEFR
ncbi:MAG: translocation/assembly module TamB domain-containing protein [Deltaproteobacteria bacterium]|nr:translocation/assembly module TamB domain-containing protein [Deltaproteobacteria bacterium]